jgi:DNA-binding IscR family transcriptional regulator
VATVTALAERIGCSPRRLARILGDQERRGRVVRDAGGGYALVVEAFGADTLTALRELD